MSEHEEHGEGGGEHEGGSHGGGGHGGGHGGGGHEEHEGAPEWLISFADNVALLMGFFVILLAMNMAKKTAGGIGGSEAMGGAPTAVEADFVIGIREAFNTPFDTASGDPKDQPYIRRILEKRNGGPATQDGPAGKYQSTQSTPTGEANRVTATINFEDRQALVSTMARQTIAETAARLKDQNWIIEVRGHVSPLETMHNQARARELSYQRAMAVATLLVENGLKWETLRVVSCGDASRVVPRALTTEDDRQNQRAEIIPTRETIAPDPYARPDETGRKPDPSKAEPKPEPKAEPRGETKPAGPKAEKADEDAHEPVTKGDKPKPGHDRR